jgi:hypothetical protein
MYVKPRSSSAVYDSPVYEYVRKEDRKSSDSCAGSDSHTEGS